ncbi:MAG: LysM peptidoglycan-binding domain-containing protein [Opitutaceae bacterium]|jgi:LysM repeat protein|nr:LysM peptidoglycan-binding domain-containing protein [Opitutaceae bacterium]
MFHRAAPLIALTLFATTLAHAQSLNVEVANMRQELDLLRQRVGELQLAVESLQREVSETRSAAAAGKQSHATINQLHDAIADLNRLIKDSNAASKSDILRTVSTQMDKLVRQTNDALADMAKTINTRSRPVTNAGSGGSTTPAPVPTFSDNYPKEGISYTVQPGDNISTIARKTGARQQDIINANRIANPKALMPNQVLFIPGGKEPAPPAQSAPPPPAPNSPVAPAAN